MKEEKEQDDFDSFEDIDIKNIKFDFKNLRQGGISWWTRLLLYLAPFHGVRSLSRELGVDPDLADKAHGVFQNVESVDIVPSKSDRRGFQLVLNRSTALYFYQDGDHFIYDGFEIGHYDKGDVTIFDEIKR